MTEKLSACEIGEHDAECNGKEKQNRAAPVFMLDDRSHIVGVWGNPYPFAGYGPHCSVEKWGVRSVYGKQNIVVEFG